MEIQWEMMLRREYMYTLGLCFGLYIRESSCVQVEKYCLKEGYQNSD